MHLPPPVHGAAMAGKYIKDSKVVNDEISSRYINLATNTKLGESGKSSVKKVFRFVSIIKQVIGAVSKNKFDLCHVSLTASGPGFYKDFIIVFILKIFNQNIIYHFHNKGVTEASKNKIPNFFYRYVFKETKSILLSPLLFPDISKYVQKENTFYCPYGIPPVNETVLTGTPPVSSGRPCQLLYFSNMMSQKGVYVLLDALSILNKKKIDFTCNFVGAWSDVTEQDFNDYLVKEGLGNKVFSHGGKYGKDKYKYFEDADIFLFPTHYHYETFGIVNLEAMQHGLAIISTPEGGIPDVVVDGKTGFLVPQKDSAQLAKKIEQLIDDPQLRKNMGKSGRTRYEHFYTLEKFERNFIDVLNKAIVQYKNN